MKKSESSRLTALIVFCFLFSLIAQSQSIDTTLSRYASKYQQERIYLHYDKSTYFPGETIWFKAYMMEGVFPAENSKTFYVDWIADNGNVLYHSVSPLVGGITNGQFEIPGDYSGNYIHIRAYTKWMLNFDSSFLYSKDIRILSKNITAAKTVKTTIIPSIQFFPEGGDAVEGITNKVAFKANDQWGRPVRVKGVIITNKGAFVDSIKSLHDGMGSFNFIPQPGTTYSAKWKDDKGTDHISELSAINPSGITMQIGIAGIKRYIKLNSTNDIKDNLKLLHLTGTMNQHIVFKTDVALAAGSSQQKIVPTSNLPSGILVITVFDANWNAVAERITFINNHDYSFEPVMEVQHWGLNKRARNEVEITVPDSIATASLSISITDAAIEKDTTDNIISHLLLTSDLKGYVYNPYWYFSHADDSASQYLDLVMLTNGWRRFKWEDVARGKDPVIKYSRDTSYLSLSGKVFGVSKSQTNAANIILLVKEKDTSTKMFVMPLNPDGNFGDPNVIFFDTLHVYYHLKSKFFSNAEAKFMTERLPAANYTGKNFVHNDLFSGDTSGLHHHSLLASQALRLQELQKSKIMETVTVTAKTKSTVQILDDKYASGLFKSADSYNFDLVNDQMSNAYPSIFYYLSSKVAGLQINPSSTPPTLQWRGSTPQLFLDEVATDADMVSGIPVTDVAYIKVFRPPFIGATGGGAGGAIAIYTRRGNDIQNKPGQGLTSSTIAGYTPVKQFYSPNYSAFNPRNEQADIRTTLYWNPSLLFDTKNHVSRVVFYNNDVTRSFRVVIEGMTKEGLLTHYEQMME